MTGSTRSTNSATLDSLLDAFQDRYRNLVVSPAAVDLTDCYWSSVAERHIAPRSYGPLPDHRVLGYVAFGGAFVKKFAKDANGRVTRVDGLPMVGRFTLEQKVMACLCLWDIRNTSLFEISDAMTGTHRVQGYRRWHLRRLVEAIKAAHPTFDPAVDSCFLFAGRKAEIIPRIALNALWLESIVRSGASMLDRLTPSEGALMSEIFPTDVLAGDSEAIARRSYMWGRDIWQPQTAEFLTRKARALRCALASSRPYARTASAGS